MGKYKKVWLVRWVSTGGHGNETIKKYAPHGNPIDILSSHKTFEWIMEYAKDVYKLQTMHIQEKIPLAHYKFGVKNRAHFFGSTVPFSTYQQCQWYRDFQNKDLADLSPNEYQSEQEKHSRFIKIGYNPQLEIREVFDFSFEDQGGVLLMSWNELVGDGSKKRIEQKTPSIFTA